MSDKEAQDQRCGTCKKRNGWWCCACAYEPTPPWGFATPVVGLDDGKDCALWAAEPKGDVKCANLCEDFFNVNGRCAGAYSVPPCPRWKPVVEGDSNNA